MYINKAFNVNMLSSEESMIYKKCHGNLLSSVESRAIYTISFRNLLYSFENTTFLHNFMAIWSVICTLLLLSYKGHFKSKNLNP